MEALLTAAGFELEPGFTCKWKAQPEDLEAARQLGYEFARKLQNKKIDQADEVLMRLLVFFLLKRLFTNNLLAKSRKVKYNRINLIIDAGRKV